MCKTIKAHPTGRRCPSWEGGRGRGHQGEHARLGCAQLCLTPWLGGVLASSGGDQTGGRFLWGSGGSMVWTVQLIKLSASRLGYIRLTDLKTMTK